MIGSNVIIYIALLGAVAFVVFTLVRTRTLPLLAELFELMLSLTAAQAGIALCIDVIQGTKSLGGYADQRFTIILGGVAVFWVALLTLVKLIKSVINRSKLPSAVPSETAVS